MKKNILLFILSLLYSMSVQAQCPPMIDDVDNNGDYYDIPLTTNAACLAAVSALGGINATVTINGQPYEISSTSCVGDPLVINLSANGTPVILSAGPVTMSWNSPSSCLYNTMGVLPITLSSFEGYAKDKINLLKWTTASETQNNGFEIQRSTDGIRFEKIGFVAGNGTTSETQNYRFEDKSQTGISYYRLKQLDFDGRFEYSKVIVIDQKGNNTVSVFPNPVSEVLNVAYLGKNNDLHSIEIYDVFGKLILQVCNDLQETEIKTSNLQSGTYIWKINQNGNIQSGKFVKM